MRQWLIKWLYSSLDDLAKWEVHRDIKCPTISEALAVYGNQAKKLFGKTE